MLLLFRSLKKAINYLMTSKLQEADSNNIALEDILSVVTTTSSTPPTTSLDMKFNSHVVDQVSPAPATKVPQPIVIKSDPIRTMILNTSSSSSPEILAQSSGDDRNNASNVAMFNNTPYTIINPSQQWKPHLFDGVGNEKSQTELINFIQKLMTQARKEQQEITSSTESSTASTVREESTQDTSSTSEVLLKSTENKSSTQSVTAPILPFRTTLRSSSTTSSVSTTTDSSPSGVITKLLSEAAAPIAGLSAATLAYSAAAMLPVWLPAALAGRKKRSLDDINLYHDINIEKYPPYRNQ